jgi:hypothetical protein
MHASSPAKDSAFSYPRRRIFASDRYDLTKRTIRVVILDIGMPEQDWGGVLDRLTDRREAGRVRLLTVLGEVPKDERKARAVQTEAETWRWKIRQFENTRGSWVHAVIFALLAGCCAITVFFAFQVPFRLRSNESHASIGQLRSEIAALPIRAGGQTMSVFRAHRSHRSAGDDRELASSSFDDSGHKRRPPRERLIQRKQLRFHIESAESRRD